LFASKVSELKLSTPQLKDAAARLSFCLEILLKSKIDFTVEPVKAEPKTIKNTAQPQIQVEPGLDPLSMSS
jgi:hypothetical protein